MSSAEGFAQTLAQDENEQSEHKMSKMNLLHYAKQKAGMTNKNEEQLQEMLKTMNVTNK